MIKICNDRSVFPNSVKISNQYENDSRSIDFDLSDVQFTGNTYLICKYQRQSAFYAPLLLDENDSIPVETFLSAQPGAYTCVIVISTVTIDADYNFSSDNPLFVSNEFTLNVGPNFLTGTATAWELTPAAQNYFDQLIALVDKVQADLDNGSFVGNGIKSITKTGSEGLVDSYQILFTDSSTFDFQVTNGATPTITIQDGVWFVNGVSTGVSALGQKGDKGDPGVGIVSIEKTSTSGNVDTYTITFTNQTTSTFTVTNGTNGKDGVTPNIQIGTVDTLPAGSQATATITGTTENPLLNLGIPQGETGGTTNYNDLENKPQINEVELKGNVTSEQLGIIAKNDNFIYKDVPKQLNPNVTDSFQRAMWNLKLYGQSTQGADPSPTNKQPITAISQFDGAPTGGNIVDWNIEQWNDIPKRALNPIITKDGLSINCNNLTTALTPTIFGQYRVNTLKLDTSKKYIASCNLTDPNITIVVRTSSGQFSLTSSNKQNILPTGVEYIQQIYINFPQGLTFNDVISFQVSVGDNVPQYTPYEAQPFTYTPTNPMYSTQDGSIADYVDVEKGVEVYNIYKIVTKPQKFGGANAEGWYSGTGYIAYRTTTNLTPITNILSNAFINTSNIGQKNNIYLSYNDLPEDLKTLDAIVEYNQTNEIEFYVVLATPTEIPIDPEQLAMLKALYTYTGVTNFLCNAPVSFTYERSLQIVINNLENAIGQTNANILLNGGNN